MVNGLTGSFGEFDQGHAIEYVDGPVRERLNGPFGSGGSVGRFDMGFWLGGHIW